MLGDEMQRLILLKTRIDISLQSLAKILKKCLYIGIIF